MADAHTPGGWPPAVGSGLEGNNLSNLDHVGDHALDFGRNHIHWFQLLGGYLPGDHHHQGHAIGLCPFRLLISDARSHNIFLGQNGCLMSLLDPSDLVHFSHTLTSLSSSYHVLILPSHPSTVSRPPGISPSSSR